MSIEQLRTPERKENPKAALYKADAVALLCGGIVPGENDTWVPTGPTHSDGYGMLDGWTRIEAAAELFFHRCTRTIVVSGGIPEKTRRQYPGMDIPPQAPIYKAALLDRIAQVREKGEYKELLGGSPAPIILTEESSERTKSSISEVLSIALRENWMQLLLLSNYGHATRAFYLADKEIKRRLATATGEESDRLIRLAHRTYAPFDSIREVSSEAVLMDLRGDRPDYLMGRYFSEDHQLALKRLANERSGMEALRKNNYSEVELWVK